jgi:hypothetical protein
MCDLLKLFLRAFSNPQTVHRKNTPHEHKLNMIQHDKEHGVFIAQTRAFNLNRRQIGLGKITRQSIVVDSHGFYTCPGKQYM